MRTHSDSRADSAQPIPVEKSQHPGRTLLWSSAVVLMITIGWFVLKRPLPPSANDSGDAVQYRVLNGTTDSNGIPTTAARFCVGSGTEERCYSPPANDPPFGLDAKVQEATSKQGKLFLFSAESNSGGSGGLIALALLKYQNGKLVNLLPHITGSNLSEHRVWDSPNGSGMPILATADFIWAEGESHYDSAHRYDVRAYVFDDKTMQYINRDHYATAQKYDGEVLEAEKNNVVARLEGRFADLAGRTPLPPIHNSPDTECDFHRQCTEDEFRGVSESLEKQWDLTPEWLRAKCGGNQTYPSMERCILSETVSWLKTNPTAPIPWAIPENFSPKRSAAAEGSRKADTVAVVAQGTIAVTGAIICPNFDTVVLMQESYERNWRETLQDRASNGQSRLIRGEPAPKPDLDLYGCFLAPSGTEMKLEAGNVVPVVSVKLVDGRIVKGVTLPSMIRPVANQN